MPDVRVSHAQELLEDAVEAVGRGEWLEAAFKADKAADICRELREVAFRNGGLRRSAHANPAAMDVRRGRLSGPLEADG